MNVVARYGRMLPSNLVMGLKALNKQQEYGQHWQKCINKRFIDLRNKETFTAIVSNQSLLIEVCFN